MTKEDVMRVAIQDINEIIKLCNDMVSYIKANGTIYRGMPGDTIYVKYKKKISSFFDNVGIETSSYFPYLQLNKLFFHSAAYSVNLNEAKEILFYVKEVKKDLFSDQYEKIFISHSEADEPQVSLFIDLLHTIGIPRPTETNPDKVIFCTSHPEGYIANGERNLETIKNEFNNDTNTFFIMWYTENYFASQACLNEMGAIWVKNKKYQEILMPKFNEKNIKGMLDKQPVWFRANNKFRLNDFKKQLEAMFALSPIEQNSWEHARDKFIAEIGKF